MKVAFTLCSNNYLSQAIVLGNSLKRTNPDYIFHIGLVDLSNSSIDYSRYPDFLFTPIHELGLPELDGLIDRYNIIELNTSVKPSYFKYLFKLYPTCTHVHYFDPDIKIFNALQELDSQFSYSSILLTPHIVSPIPDDDFEPKENMFLNYGIYNLGYLGLKRDEESFKLLDWWEGHTLGLGHMDVKNGYFVDQLWMNHVPLFFQGVHILREKGYNCGPWNLQERSILKKEQYRYILDDLTPLTFYHFSSFNPNLPDQLSSVYNRNTFENRPEFKELYANYASELLDEKYNDFKSLACGLYKNDTKSKENERVNSIIFFYKLKTLVRLFTPPLFINAYQLLRKTI